MTREKSTMTKRDNKKKKEKWTRPERGEPKKPCR
jgi:hypothetical protein